MTARRKVVRLCESKRICCLDALHAALFAPQSARSPGWHAHPKWTRRARLPGPSKSCLPVRFSCHMRGRQSVIRQAPISWRWRGPRARRVQAERVQPTCPSAGSIGGAYLENQDQAVSVLEWRSSSRRSGFAAAEQRIEHEAGPRHARSPSKLRSSR